MVDNAGETWLTALFAGEYAGQFGLMLPLLARLGLPMPLGGTSNHFRTRALRDIGGWDPLNVTEDADIGVRLARRGMITDTIDSRTAEEAPVHFSAWLMQRTRWMKGWMQTFIVHNSHPRELFRELGLKGFLGFQIYVASMIMSGPLHTLFVASIIATLLVNGLVVDIWLAITCVITLVGYGGPAALVVAGLRRLGRTDLIPIQLMLPIYWVLHSLAGFRAMRELIARPYFWAKTRHGETRMMRQPAGRRRDQLRSSTGKG